MRKKLVVLSLGGSLIIPEEIDVSFLKEFKKIIQKHADRHKFIVVCGGGSIARKYIRALRETGKKTKLQNMSGIAITRLNARFLTYFFGKEANEGIPHNISEVKNLLRKNSIVFCGALRYAKNETSDGTAAKLARFFHTELINLTKVQGLYDKDPHKNKNAKFIPKISWKDFLKTTNKIKYSPGQHFVLDQNAAKIINQEKIKTYILGKNLKNLDNLLSEKQFQGTIISD